MYSPQSFDSKEDEVKSLKHTIEMMKQKIDRQIEICDSMNSALNNEKVKVNQLYVETKQID